MITGENFIAGRRSANGSSKFRTFDPELNLENPWEFVEATENELNEAVDQAGAAFEAFSLTPDEDRAALLREIASNIDALGNELLEVYHKETGLGLARARAEKTRTIFQLNLFANLITSENWRGSTYEAADPERLPIAKPGLFKTYIPLGPIAVFGASNFPFAYSTAGGDTASALAAGCPVIVKSHPMHAGTGEMVASAIATAIQELELHPGIFSNLNARGYQIGTKLVMHPGIKAVGFTGSIGGGRALFDLAASRNEPIPVFAEMGSINPVVISASSLKKNAIKWVEKYASSITNGTGQFCTNPGLILGIASNELTFFANQLAEKIAGMDSTVMLHPDISAHFKANRKIALNQPGVELLNNNNTSKPNYAEQTIAMVSGQQFLKNPQLHKEVFGPYSIVVECNDMAELKHIVTSLEGQLTGTIIVEKEEMKQYIELISIMSHRAGRLILNGVPTGVEVTRSMTHGGPYPASTDSRFTAVGDDAIKRWLRPVTYQNFPDEILKLIGWQG